MKAKEYIRKNYPKYIPHLKRLTGYTIINLYHNLKEKSSNHD